MTYFVYAFEAKDIQEYILERTRLAEMMGASAMIDTLCNEVLDACLDALELEESKQDFQTARRGGGGFTLVFTDQAKALALRDLISLVLPQFAPDLPFVHAVAEHADLEPAIKAALDQLPIMQQQTRPPRPIATPLIQRAPRTGLPAWGQFPSFDGEAVDRAALAKRRFREDRLGRKFLDDANYSWPKNLNPDDPKAREDTLFPFENDNHRVAVVHIDGNGFGQALTDVRQAAQSRPDWVAVEYAFSRLVDEMGCEAVELATLQILESKAEQTPSGVSVMPARPLVLGGDDLTIILRADVALDFVASYIREFESVSEKKIKDFSREYGVRLPNTRMTACAGIAFIGAKRPFDRAYHLAEALCAEAKRASTQARDSVGCTGISPSFLAFGDSTASLSRDEDILVHSPRGARLSGTAYQLGDSPTSGCPSFEGLTALKKLFADNPQRLARSALNDIIGHLRHDEDEAQRRWQRWLDVMERRGAQDLVGKLKQHLAGVAPEHDCNADQDPLLTHPQMGRFSPLGDVLAWLKAEARFNDND